MYPGILFVSADLFLLYKGIEGYIKTRVFTQDVNGFLFGAAFLVFGVIVLTNYSLFKFKINQQKLYWKRISPQVGTVPFSDIKNVVLWVGPPGSMHSLNLQVQIVTEKEKIPLPHYYETGHKEDFQPIVEMMISGNKVDAIKLAERHYKMSITEAEKFVEGLVK